MDFVSDQLYNGKRFRVLTLIDLFIRECLAAYADKAIKGEGVCEILKHGAKPCLSGAGLLSGVLLQTGPLPCLLLHRVAGIAFPAGLLSFTRHPL